MKVTDRFILKAYLGPMILTFFIVMFILLMHFLWMKIDMIVGKGLSYWTIAELLMYASMTFMPMALPLATLLASIMTMGNLGENYELLALKASGVSLPRIMRPLIVLMVFVSIGSFFVINNLTPYAYDKMYNLLYDFKNTKHEMKLQDGIFFNGFDNISIRVDHQDRETGELHNVLMYDNSSNDEMKTIVAESGYLTMSDDKKYVIVTLFNGQMYEQTRGYEWYSRNVLKHNIFEYQQAMFAIEGYSQERREGESLYGSSSQVMNMKQLDYVIDSLTYLQDSVLTLFEKSMVQQYIFKQYAFHENLDSIPAQTEIDMIPRLDTMSIEHSNFIFEEAKRNASHTQNYLSNQVNQVRYPSINLYRAEEEYHKKLALPFSIMIFFLIGAPLGAIIRKGGLGMPIVISVSFFIIYYIISITGENFVKDGVLPAYIGVWLSSFVLFPVAVFLTYKSTNDSALLNAEVYIIKIKQFRKFIRTKILRKNDDKNS